MASHKDQILLRQGPPLAEARGVLILLHGQDSDAESAMGLSSQLSHEGLAYLVPQADAGNWFPYSFLVPQQQNEAGIASATTVIASLVTEADLYGVPPERVILFGFSQGACIALEFALRYPRRYGAIIALSGGLMGPPGTNWICQQSMDGTPIFLGCSDVDPHAPRSRVEESRDVLTGVGAEVTIKLYRGMGHTISDEEIGEVNKIISQVLAASSGTL